MRVKGRIAVTFLIGVPLLVVAVFVVRQVSRSGAGTEDDFLRRIEEARQEAAPSEGPGLLAPDAGQGGEMPKPVISVDEEDLELGTIPNTGPTVIQLPIRNTGNALLEIQEVKSSCLKCLLVDMEGKETLTVEPGAEEFLKVTMKPAGISGFEAFRTLSFMSNDPKTPMLVVSTHAKIEPEFELVPDTQLIDFGDVDKGSRPEMAFVVRQLGEELIQVEEITTQGDATGVEFSFEKRPQTEWESSDRAECTVRIALNTEEMPVGSFKGAFYLGTTCERVPWLPCTLEASVNSFFSVTPSSLSLLRLKPGERELGTITVKADCPIEIRDLAISADDMKAVMKPGVSPNTAIVEVAVAEGAEAGKREEQLSFTVASDDKSVRHTTRIHGVLRGPGAKQTRQESAASQQDGKATPSG